MEYGEKLKKKSGAELSIKMRTLEDYARMVTGMDIQIGLSVKSNNSIEVYSTVINFSEIVKSWCNYYNCIISKEYILTCKITTANIAVVSIEVRDSIGKNICYNSNGIRLYKLFKKQIEPDGKYRKKTVGYIVEKEEENRETHIKTFDCTEKKEAKRLYKQLVEKEKLQYKRGRVKEE